MSRPNAGQRTNAVVFVAGRDPTMERGGGHTTYVRAHARAAIMAGFAPHIFCISRRGLEVATDFGVVHSISSPFRRSPGLMQPELRNHLVPWHAPLLIQAVESFMATGPGAGLIHAFGVSGCVGVEVARRFRRRGREIVAVVSAWSTNTHESEARARAVSRARGRRLRYQLEHLWTSLVVDRYERRAYAGADLVLVNYQSVQRLLMARYGLPASRFRLLPYTAEAAFLGGEVGTREPVPAPVAALGAPEAPLLVAVSRHDPRKGVDVLIGALGRLSTAGVPFRACLIGPGPLRSVHARLVDALGLGNRVAVPGWVPDPAVYLRHADIFALPSLEEGSGSLALLEAMQAGVAPIVSNLDGLPEDVNHGENALLVEPGDERGLADTIARLLRDESLRRRLGARARETFLARFSADAFARALGETYADLTHLTVPGR